MKFNMMITVAIAAALVAFAGLAQAQEAAPALVMKCKVVKSTLTPVVLSNLARINAEEFSLSLPDFNADGWNEGHGPGIDIYDSGNILDVQQDEKTVHIGYSNECDNMYEFNFKRAQIRNLKISKMKLLEVSATLSSASFSEDFPKVDVAYICQ